MPGSVATPAARDEAAVADRVLETVPRVMRRIREAMRTQAGGASGMTVPQLRALLRVRREPGSSLSALAEHLGMTPPACSGLVERLVRAGWVQRTTDPLERRRLQLHLTPSGAEQVAHANLRARTWLVDALAELPAADLAALETTLGVLDRVAAETGPA